MSASLSMNHTLQRSCPICGCGEGRRLFEQRFETMPGFLPFQGYHVVVCGSCGFGFADSIPDQSDFDAYYRDMSKYDCPEATPGDSEFEILRLADVAAIVDRFVPGKDSAILDLGCGSGGLLHMLDRQGYSNLLGLDPSPRSAEIGQREHGIQVLTGTLFHFPKRDVLFDFIVLLAVLEHVRDLPLAVKCLRELLTDEGRIYICVPDASRFAEGTNAPFQEFSVEHINFFSPVSLRNLLASGGLKEIHCEQGMARANASTTAPIIHAIYQKDPGASLSMGPRDDRTEPALTQYVRESEALDREIRPKIEALVESAKPLLVWGTGSHTMRLMASTRLSEAAITAFVDSNPRYQGKQLNGIPIIGPQDVPGRDETILISSRVFQAEIAAQIREELKCRNEMILLYDL